MLEWIFKAEKFFNYHHTPDAERVDIAAIHFEKDVVPWFQMLQCLSAVRSWTDLTKAMESQFGPSPFDCPMAELFKQQQVGTISDYYLQFMSLANRSFGLSVEALLNCFLSCLHVEIRRDVVAQAPSSLLRAVALVKLYEDRYIALPQSKLPFVRRYSQVGFSSASAITSSPKVSTNNTLPLLLHAPNIKQLRDANVKKITPAEMQIRCEKGLCYFCDEKFSFNHKCPNKQYLFLQLEDIDTESPSASVPLVSTSKELSNSLVEDPHLSFNALKGGQGVGTI